MGKYKKLKMQEENMKFIDPHVHMTSRTTDDYENMAAAGVVAIIEPSFWLGQPRQSIWHQTLLYHWLKFQGSQ